MHVRFRLQCWDVIAKLRGYNNIAKGRGKTKGSRIFQSVSRFLSKIVGCLFAIRHFKMKRELGRVNFRKDFWDCCQGQGKKLANSWSARLQLRSRKHLRYLTFNFGSSSLLFSNVAQIEILLWPFLKGFSIENRRHGFVSIIFPMQFTVNSDFKKKCLSVNVVIEWMYFKVMNCTHLFPLQVFTANSDRNTIVSHVLTPRFRARYVRFVVLTWHNHISMRVELYGCSAP